MPHTGPIGVFDSGIGGLSVLKEIRALLPHEDLLYVADSGHVPYGDKSEAYIQQRSLEIGAFLLAQGAKVLVVACNTATAAAVTRLRETFAVPIVGMEPAVKPAVAASRSGVVGVLATVGTLASAKFAALLSRYGSEVEIVTQPCPGLVEQVERADLDGPQTRDLVESYVLPLLARGADTLILGCTHYPFLRPLIAEVAGPDIAIIDTGAAVARQLRRVLGEAGLLTGSTTAGGASFWTSGDLGRLRHAVSTLWGRDDPTAALPPAPVLAAAADLAG